MKTASAFAPAKINLTLHVTGRRADGYHELDSLVCFADVGDRVTVRRAGESRLTVNGRFAASVPRGPENLVFRAARLMGVSAEIELEKNLPVASGLGGGSADAAAAVAALSALTGKPMPGPADLLALGADVPVCAMGGLVRMQGIGERLTPLEARMSLPMILANPGVPVSTPDVFARLDRKSNSPMPEPLPGPADDLADWLRTQRNDLEAPAIAVCPEIGHLLDLLRAQPGCRLARMSGSGASCYAIFADKTQAEHALRRLGETRPAWWTALAHVSDRREAAERF